VTWATVQVSIPQVRAALDAFDVVDTVLGAVDAAYAAIEPVTTLLLATQSNVSLAGAAGAAAIAAARAAVNTLNGQGGLYLLNVPVLASSKGSLSLPHIPIQSLGDLTRGYGVRAPDNLANRSGNYGLFQTIVESLYDTADISRPSLDPDKHTAALLVVYGGDTFIDALPQIVALNELFGPAVPIPLHGYVLPIPQNVKLRSVPTPERSIRGRTRVNVGSFRQNTSLVIRWDEDAPYSRLPGYANTTTRRIAWRVYVKQGAKIKAGEDLEGFRVYEKEIVSAAVPSVGTVYEDNSYGATLVGLDPDETYYVSVAYVVEVYNSIDGKKVRIEPTLSSLSEQYRVVMRERPVPRQFSRGIPPDWIALKSALSAIPAVADSVESVLNELELLDANLAGATGAAVSNLSAVAELPARARARIGAIAEQIERAATLAGAISGGVWSTAYASTGTEVGLINWLQKQLLDDNITNQPPFKTGNGVVGAMMFVAQADTAQEAGAALAALGEIVGGQPSAAPAILSIQDPTRGANPVVNPPVGAVGAPQTPADSTTASSPLKDLGVGDDPC